MLRESDVDYDAARRVFNGIIDRRPRLIVRPADSEDVALSIAYAREHGLPLAIRGAGHNVAGNAVVDGGLVIDHSHLREVSVDAGGPDCGRSARRDLTRQALMTSRHRGDGYGHRGSAYVYNLIGTWTDADQDSIHVNWARSLFDELRPRSTGAAYVNFLGDDGSDRASAAYGSSLSRLSELKRRYDPDNVFHLNQNILPG